MVEHFPQKKATTTTLTNELVYFLTDLFLCVIKYS